MNTCCTLSVRCWFFQCVWADLFTLSLYVKKQLLLINVIIVVIMAAHLGFVNGAVQRIVLLVVQQTEVQRPQRSCRETDRERESSAAVIILISHGIIINRETHSTSTRTLCWVHSYWHQHNTSHVTSIKTGPVWLQRCSVQLCTVTRLQMKPMFWMRRRDISWQQNKYRPDEATQLNMVRPRSRCLMTSGQIEVIKPDVVNHSLMFWSSPEQNQQCHSMKCVHCIYCGVWWAPSDLV